MNTKYTIKNFRVFDEKGVTVDIKPITILTGCNSSGKSSIVKSMVLLDTYIASLLDDYKAFNKINLKKHKLDFTKNTTSSLGNFNRVLHNGSTERTITFQYQVHSLMLGEDVFVSLVFGAEESDELNEGYLLEITISNPSGEVIYTSSEKNLCKANYNLIRNNFFRFVYGQQLVDKQQKYKSQRILLYGSLTEEEFHNFLKELPKDLQEEEMTKETNLNESRKKIDFELDSFVSLYGEEALNDIEEWYSQYGIDYSSRDFKVKSKDLFMDMTNKHPEIVDNSLQWNTLFYFPLLEKINNLDKNSFKKGIISILDGLKIEQEVLLAIDKITADFISSDCNSFGDYYKMQESSFMEFSANHFHKLRKLAPLFIGTDIFNFDWKHNNYLGWTTRMLGPSVVEDSFGNLISMKGMGELEEWKEYPINFSMLYNVLMNINNMLDSSESPYFYETKSLEHHYKTYQHRLFDMFKKYVLMAMREVVTSAIPQNISYVGTSLVNVKRDYSLDSQDSFVNLVKKYFAALRNYRNSIKGKKTEPESFISRWIKKFGIGHSFGIEKNPSGSSFVIRLYKSENDKTGSLLAEEGYGITQLFTILLRIETAILESKKTVICNSYEEAQEPIKALYAESTIAIEEPEVHLHPNFQSLLADMFFEAYNNYNVHFIIETHSEYLIRRSQVIVAGLNYKSNAEVDEKCPFQTCYVPKGDFPYSLGYRKDGKFKENFGTGFYDEASNLAFDIL